MASETARPPVAVICALEEELVHLRRALPPGREEWRVGRCAWRTELDGLPLVLVVCGMGMLTAAAVTESVIGQYGPAVVLNYGCAGAHRPELLPGDIVIGVQVVAYDNLREQPDGSQTYAGMRYLRRGITERATALPANERLLHHATSAAATLEGQHEHWPPTLAWPAAIDHRSPQVVFGVIGSADRWNRTAESIGALVARHETHCEDMEAAAIALACASHDVPFLSVKDISNTELHAKTESGGSFLEWFGPQLGRRAGALPLAILREIATSSRGL
ncbi:MAG: 5'-methylthioadenosine/S-adenosylhomocysteine nucleosidase [Chloroflexota bacterium]